METLAYVPFQRYSAQWQACVHSMYINRHLWEVLTYTWWSYLHVSVLLLFPPNQGLGGCFNSLLFLFCWFYLKEGFACHRSCSVCHLGCFNSILFLFCFVLFEIGPLYAIWGLCCHLGFTLGSGDPHVSAFLVADPTGGRTPCSASNNVNV